MIKYFGGKSRLIKKFMPYLPKHPKRIIDLFVGGGSCVSQFCQVYPADVPKIINDIDYNLITFYRIVQNSDLVELSNWFSLHRKSLSFKKVKTFKDRLLSNKEDLINRAFIYYTCVYCGYGGQPYATPTQDKFNQYMTRDIYEDLRRCKDVLRHCSIYNQDYTDFVFVDSFYYCDPPYYRVSRPYYGHNGTLHKNFSHEDFYAWITDVAKNNTVMISYDDADYIRTLYQDWNIIEIPKNTVAYSPKNKDATTVSTNELLILNYKNDMYIDIKSKLF